MVAAVDEHMGAEQGVEKAVLQIVGGVERVFPRMPVKFWIGDFPDRAAEIEIDQLHPLADPEDRLPVFAKQIQSAELFQCEQHVGKRNAAQIAVGTGPVCFGKKAGPAESSVRTVREPAEEGPVVGVGGEHISAAWQK